MRFWIQLFIAVCSITFGFYAYADTAAMKMLEQMTEASKNLNYEGVFAYQTGKNLQSIRIIHRSDDHGEAERLISLNGVAREVIRSNDTVTCINPQGKRVSVSRRPLTRGFPSDLPRRLNAASAFYDVTLGRDGRVADRKATALVITPVDNYRYGYRLWVDKKTNLLLKSELVAGNGNVLETFAFSSLKTGIDIPDSMLKPQTSGKETTWHRTEPEVNAEMATHNSLSDWRAQWLPKGFSLVALQTRLRADNGAPVEQRVYSDGLSSVSVFIEQKRAHHNIHLTGASHVGAVNAFGTQNHAHYVTVVGEVPAETVRKIGESVEFLGGKH